MLNDYTELLFNFFNDSSEFLKIILPVACRLREFHDLAVVREKIIPNHVLDECLPFFSFL